MKHIFRALILSASATATLASCGNSADSPSDVIFSSDEFSVYTDRVKQGPYTATAVSPTKIVTDYKSRSRAVCHACSTSGCRSTAATTSLTPACRTA